MKTSQKIPQYFVLKYHRKQKILKREYMFGKHIHERFSLEMRAILMFQIFLKKSDIFGCLYFGAGFFFSNFGFCNIGFGFSSLSSFRARFGTGISASTISKLRFNGALTSSRSFCRYPRWRR